MNPRHGLRPLRRAVVAAALVALCCVVPIGLDAGTASAAPGDEVFGDLDVSGLVDLGPLQPTDPGPLTFLIGLTKDQAGLEAHARATSDPASTRYGERSSVAALAERYGASVATRNAVTDYFETTFGVSTSIDPTGSYATVVLSLAQAEAAFSTTWHVYGFPVGTFYNGLTMLYPDPSDPPEVPAALQGAVEVVDGAALLYTGPATALETQPASVATAQGGTAVRTGVAEGCSGALDQPVAPGSPNSFGIAPNQLKTAYQLDQLHARGLRGEGMRVAVIDQSSYDPAWLATYRSCFGLDDATPVIDHVVGTPDTSIDGMTETILDLSVLSFAAPKVDRFDVFINDTTPNPNVDDIAGGMVQMFTMPLDATQTGGVAPDVISASFDMCEVSPLYWQGHGPAIRILENVLSTAAAAGITYVVATGDSGSSGCFHNLGVQAPEAEVLSASYPSTSKWVTAVGGTNLTLNADNSIASSGVWNDVAYGLPVADGAGGGGGGTSTLIERPWYQDLVPAASPMRTVPDISLFADELPGYMLYAPTDAGGGVAGPPAWSYEGGTSAATPLFSGMALLLGQQAKANSQPTLGFANPLLYRLGAAGSSALLDITQGDNILFPAAVDCCAAGPGYDLATGWGSPLAQAMTTALAAPTVSVTGTGSSDGSFRATYVAQVAVPAGQVLSYQWDTNGDGLTDATTTGPTLTTTAAVAGVQTTRLTVVTSLGRIGSGVASATVSQPLAAPTPTPRSLAFVG
jgi:kumamolisin